MSSIGIFDSVSLDIQTKENHIRSLRKNYWFPEICTMKENGNRFLASA